MEMDSGYTGFLFLSLFVLITLVISFRWCCRRMRLYDEMMREIEEEHERRRRVAEDMWIISVQQHEQSPHGPQGDTSIRGPSNYPFQAGGGGKPPDELPSYEEALKLPPIHSKDTTSHV